MSVRESKPPKAGLKASEKFIEAARELECDESEKAFTDTLGKLAAVRPEDAPRKPKGKR